MKTAFIMGFCIYVPFILVDLLVSTVLMSLGMMMMPPVVVSADQVVAICSCRWLASCRSSTGDQFWIDAPEHLTRWMKPRERCSALPTISENL